MISSRDRKMSAIGSDQGEVVIYNQEKGTCFSLPLQGKLNGVCGNPFQHKFQHFRKINSHLVGETLYGLLTYSSVFPRHTHSRPAVDHGYNRES